MNNIPFFNYLDLFAQHREELTNVFQKVAECGAFIMQNDLVQFEQRLSEYTGIKYVLGVVNATDAMQLLLKAEGIGVGDEVIFCTHTMVVGSVWLSAGFSAEVIAKVVERLPVDCLDNPPMRLALPDAPAPTSRFLEKAYYLSVDDVSNAVKKIVDVQFHHVIPV